MITENVKNIFDKQHKKGLHKYGTTVDDAKLTPAEWITHAQEEAADMMVYLEKLKREWNNIDNYRGSTVEVVKGRSVGQIEVDVLLELLHNIRRMTSVDDVLEEIHQMIDDTII